MLGRVAKVDVGVDPALLSGSRRDFLLINEVALWEPLSSAWLPGLKHGHYRYEQGYAMPEIHIPGTGRIGGRTQRRRRQEPRNISALIGRHLVVWKKVSDDSPLGIKVSLFSCATYGTYNEKGQSMVAQNKGKESSAYPAFDCLTLLCPLIDSHNAAFRHPFLLSISFWQQEQTRGRYRVNARCRYLPIEPEREKRV